MSVGVLAANREWAQVPDGYASLVEQLLRAPGVDPDRSALVDEAGAVWSRPGFDTILSQSHGHNAAVSIRDSGQQPCPEVTPLDHLIIGVAAAAFAYLDALARVERDQPVPHDGAHDGTGDAAALGDGRRRQPPAQLGDPRLDGQVVDLRERPRIPPGDHMSSHDRGIAGVGGGLVVPRRHPLPGMVTKQHPARVRRHVRTGRGGGLHLREERRGLAFGWEGLRRLTSGRVAPVRTPGPGRSLADPGNQALRPSSQAWNLVRGIRQLRPNRSAGIKPSRTC
jgi:hypothetical protein